MTRFFYSWMCAFAIMAMASSSTVNATKETAPQATPAAHAVPSVAPTLNVVTTLAVIASIAKEIGGDRVVVNSLTEPAEDPHFVKAKPTFKRLVADAQLFVQIGRSLELWVPQVIAASGNAKLFGTGFVSVSSGMKALEVPSELSRDKGDIHPQGNPHVWLSALGGLKMAEIIKAALVTLDGAHKATYEKNFTVFKDRLSKALFGEELVKASGNADFLWRLHEGKKLKEYLAAKKTPVGGWLKIASNIDYPFLTYHKVWSYFVDEFELNYIDAIEEKSGVAPTPKYIEELTKRANEKKVKHIFDARYYIGNTKVMDVVAAKIGGKKIFIDADCLPGETFVAMMDRIFKNLTDFKGSAAPAPAPLSTPSSSSSAPLKK